MIQKNDSKTKLLFSKRFKRALAVRGHESKSLAELGELFNLSKTMLHELKHGNKMVSIYSAADIAMKLDVNYEWLLTGNGDIESFQLKSATEVTLMEQFRNLTKSGQLKMMTFAFDECKTNEKTAKSREERQTALKLVRKKT